MCPTRRTFLKQVSTAGAVGALSRISGQRLWALPVSALFPEPDEALLRGLALKAIDAARAAGASFADIRLLAGRSFGVNCVYFKNSNMPPYMGLPSISFAHSYGIRAVVDGAWGFVGGTTLTVDGVTDAARRAVAAARANKPRRRRALELAPVAPVANGTWATPMAQDPLDVPLGEQADLQLAALEEATKIKDITSANVGFGWRRPTTVFASTEGSLIVQRHAIAIPRGSTWARVGREEIEVDAEGLRAGGYGYEALGGRRIIPAMCEAAETAVALAQAAQHATSVEVGRYDIVFGPDAVMALLATTLATAVDADRALGYQANGAGTSFAAPPADMLGTFQAAAPMITVRGDRTRPGGAATVGWDDEGVKPEVYTFIQNGVIVDYHTSRETAMQLGDSYRRRRDPVRAHGVVRRCGAEWPRTFLPNLTLEPGPDAVTVEDLLKDVKKGLYVERVVGDVDQQVINAQYGAPRTHARYITNGKLGGYVKEMAFQFLTTPFWKSIDAIGGAGSAKAMAAVTDGGANPVQPFPRSTMEVVPIRARQVNVLSTGSDA